jgi:DASS family divalent anion:Na+ symporter
MGFWSRYKQWILLAIPIAVGLVLAMIPEPRGVDHRGWELFAIFVATVLGIILKPFPMGVIALLGLTVAVVTRTMSFADAFSGFSNEVSWLIVFAFFVARGFIVTGLGTRLAYKVMSLLGKNSLGLGYGLVATDLILAPTIPSVTARLGGVIYPILKALAEVFTGKSHDPRMGAFLTLTAFQGSAITSAMFLTSMAGNPLIAQLASENGVTMTWGSWALAAFVPGLVSLVCIPLAIYKLAPPTIRQTPHARDLAREKLAHLGPMTQREWIMTGVFVLLIVLWVFGTAIAMKATVAAMIGLMILLVSGILKWKDVLEEHGAWDTFIWFSTLVTLATFLNKYGLTTWFSNWVVANVSGSHWILGFLAVSLIYFYTHYFFASNVAHIGAMYAPLLIVSIAMGTPPELAAFVLAFYSNLFGGLTHYGSGPAPILFGTGYTTVVEWWKIGAIASGINIVIWMVVGGVWWKLLGYW